MCGEMAAENQFDDGREKKNCVELDKIHVYTRHMAKLFTNCYLGVGLFLDEWVFGYFCYTYFFAGHVLSLMFTQERVQNK